MDYRDRARRLKRNWRAEKVVWRRKWRRATPFRLLTLGFATYVLIGLAAIAFPCCRRGDASCVDHFFNVVSAATTTGLTVGAVGETYTFWGNLVLLTLIQVGGVGYMTLTSCIILARGDRLSPTRTRILGASFSLPDGFSLRRFIVAVVVYSALIESIGAWVLWREFKIVGVDQPFWQAVFHSISAFATAGFSLFSDGCVGFKDSVAINVALMSLSWAGAIGFIVPVDCWENLRGRRQGITLTSKTILYLTAALFLGGTVAFWLFERLSGGESASDATLLAAAFQATAASTTGGFNTLDVGALGPATRTILVALMFVGAAPSGTGGGVKTTTVSAFVAIVASVVRGRPDDITFWGKTIPPCRLFTAVASAAIFVVAGSVATILLCATEPDLPFDALFFEAISAISTAGMSAGITSELSTVGKLIVAAAMFVGRVGPLTFALAVWSDASGGEKEKRRDSSEKAFGKERQVDDLAV